MEVPSVILGLEAYRSKYNKSKSDLNIDNVSTNLRDRSKSIFLWLNSQVGYNRFKQMAIEMKHISYLKTEDYCTVRGILAEIYLLVTLEEFVKVNKITDWKIYHSLVIPFKSGKGSTEIDLVVVSLTTILIIEVKSYNGEKTLTDECTLNVSGQSLNLFEQNHLHFKALWEYIAPYALITKGCIKLLFFNFSEGETMDNRSLDNIIFLPFLDENSIINFMFDYKDNTLIRWKSGVYSVFDKLSKSDITLKEHIEYVKSIHGKSD